MFDLNADVPDVWLAPRSLASIVPILRVANEIEKVNDRVAYLCRFHAFERAHKMDPNSRGRGVNPFKTYMLHRIQEEEERTENQLAKTDTREIQKFYQNFYEEYIREGQYTKKPEEMAKIYRIAMVLYDALKTVVPASKVDPKTEQYANDVEAGRRQYEHYNDGNKPAWTCFPSIKFYGKRTVPLPH